MATGTIKNRVTAAELNYLKSSIGAGIPLGSVNLNDIIENGVYALSSGFSRQNSPSSYGTLIVTGGSSDHNQMTQILVISGKVYIRYCSNRAQHAWLAWYVYNGTAT